MSNLNDYFQALNGRWSFMRSEASGHMTGGGRAAFTRQSNDTYLYSEVGRYYYPGNPAGRKVTGTRQYIYALENGGLVIRFVDGQNPGSEFHLLKRFTLMSGGVMRAEGRHECLEDVYDGVYLFGGSKHFDVIQKVSGPRKDYLISTHYRRYE